MVVQSLQSAMVWNTMIIIDMVMIIVLLNITVYNIRLQIIKGVTNMVDNIIFKKNSWFISVQTIIYLFSKVLLIDNC